MKKVFTLLFALVLAVGVSASFAASRSVIKAPSSHPASAPSCPAGTQPDTDNDNDDSSCAKCNGGDHDADNDCKPPKKCDDDEVLKNGKCVPKPTKKSGPPGCVGKAVTDPTAPPKSSNCAFVFGSVFLTGPDATANCAIAPQAAPAAQPSPGPNAFTATPTNCVGEKGVEVRLFNKMNSPPSPAPAKDPAGAPKQKRVASPAASVTLTTTTDSQGRYGFLVPAGVTYYVCETIVQGEVQSYPTGTEQTQGKKAKSHGEGFSDGPAGAPGTGTPNGDTSCRDAQVGSTGEAMRADEHNNGWYVTPAIGDPLYNADFANAPTCGPGGAEENGAVSYGLVHRQGGVETSVLAPFNGLTHDVINCQIVTGLGL